MDRSYKEKFPWIFPTLRDVERAGQHLPDRADGRLNTRHRRPGRDDPQKTVCLNAFLDWHLLPWYFHLHDGRDWLLMYMDQ